MSKSLGKKKTTQVYVKYIVGLITFFTILRHGHWRRMWYNAGQKKKKSKICHH